MVNIVLEYDHIEVFDRELYIQLLLHSFGRTVVHHFPHIAFVYIHAVILWIVHHLVVKLTFLILLVVELFIC